LSAASQTKLRRFKNRKKETSENYILTNLGTRAMEFRSCKGYFPPKAAIETSLYY